MQLSHKPLPFRMLEYNFNELYVLTGIFAGLVITISTAVDILAYASLNAPGSEFISNVFNKGFPWTGVASVMGLSAEFFGVPLALLHLEGKFIDGFYEKRGSKLPDRVLSYKFDGKAADVIYTAHQALVKGALYDQIVRQELDRESFVKDTAVKVFPAK